MQTNRLRFSMGLITWMAAINLSAAGLSEINAPKKSDDDQITALVNARLIDGQGGTPIENAVVVVKGSKILSVGLPDVIEVPNDSKRVDLSGLTVLPGLMDSHFHSINDLRTPVDYLLVNGVTSFRDPGHPFRFYQAVMQSDIDLPRVFLCGAHLDLHPAIWPQQAVLIRDAAHARKTVHEHIDRGASAIKIYFRLPLEYHAPICEEAAKRGVLVTAHLELVEAVDAIRAGVRGIEHITSFGTSLAAPSEAGQFKKHVRFDPTSRERWRHKLWSTIDLENSPRVKPLLDLLVEKGVFVSPTVALFERRLGHKNATEEDVRGFKNMMRFIGMCHQAGAKVVVGSHTGVPFAKPGEAYQREMELLLEAGLTPLEVLTAATANNAAFFKAEDRLGSIEPNKAADLVIVNGNPAEDIQAMRSVRHVMLHGKWIGNAPQ